MLNFESDYIQGACTEVLDALVKTNMEPLSGYGSDKYCESARKKILAACRCKTGTVEFAVGGTQTNQLIIDSILKPIEGVVSVKTGHVAMHEAGAIEYTGHKVLEIPSHNGKMNSDELADFIKTFYDDGNHEHMVFPGMVYITFPTEYGTLYSKEELKAISKVCRKNKLPLYIDGARLGYALASKECDLTLSEIAKLCDVFYIGGTKVGALCGEAIVFTRNNEPEHFTNLTKKHGALLAKGRLLGVQFDALFTDNLYEKISRNAIEKADALKAAFKEKGYEFFLDSPTNQQFIILENSKMKELSKKVQFSFWENYDEDHTVVRFATSWATTQEDVDELIKLI